MTCRSISSSVFDHTLPIRFMSLFFDISRICQIRKMESLLIPPSPFLIIWSELYIFFFSSNVVIGITSIFPHLDISVFIKTIAG